MATETQHMKYGDDRVCMAQFDAYVFHKIGFSLVEIFHSLEMTPNMVTFLSMMSGFYSIYLLYLGKQKEAAIYYLIGYILDCVDGRLA